MNENERYIKFEFVMNMNINIKKYFVDYYKLPFKHLVSLSNCDFLCYFTLCANLRMGIIFIFIFS